MKKSHPQTTDSDWFMAGTTGLEPATSAVTARKYFATLRNQGQRMAVFSALGTLRKRYCSLVEPATSVHQTSAQT